MQLTVTTPTLPAPTGEFVAVLDQLEQLTRDHQTFFRLQVGGLMLDSFFGGDPAAYLSRDPTKASKYVDFVRACRERLDDLGLGDTVLRRCVVTRIVYDSLPADLAARLRFSHLVELAKVDDGATRSLLATASVDNQWSVDQLRDAVLAARAGRWIDGKPDDPGLQPPPAPPEPVKKPQAGRVVTRFERSIGDMRAAAAEWRSVDPKKASAEHRKRIEKAVAAFEAEVVALRQGLAG